MKRVLVGCGVVLLLLVALGVGSLLWLKHQLSSPMAPPGAPTVELAVAKGVSGRGLGPQLVSQGLVRSPFLWHWSLKLRGNFSPKAGRHVVSPSMSMDELASALEGPPLPEDVAFSVIEGWRLRDTDAALSAAGLITPGAYREAASHAEQFTAPFQLPTGTLEGYLYPETYHVVPGALNVHELIQRQLDTFSERFYVPHRDEVLRSGRTLHEVVTMASMLEREEPVPAQRALVAGILWKRVDKGFALGVDATSRYELPEWNDRKAFLLRLRDASDPWNSRLHKGLPPGPIGSPTVESLQAALAPKPSEFWYYLHDSERHLHPSRNAEEHEALRRKYNIY